MIEGREYLGLALKASQTLGIGTERLGQRFDGDIAFEVSIRGSVDDTHAAGADLITDGIRTNLSAGGKRQDHAQIKNTEYGKMPRYSRRLGNRPSFFPSASIKPPLSSSRTAFYCRVILLFWSAFMPLAGRFPSRYR
jgi:hypothetical protein